MYDPLIEALKRIEDYYTYKCDLMNKAVEVIEELEKENKSLSDRLNQSSITPKMIRFMLDGCDINFLAEAPEDITLKQLLEQCDKIRPHWCACGIRSLNKYDLNDREAEIEIGYTTIRKTNDDVSCDICETNGANY